jgi:dihydrofolate reductase
MKITVYLASSINGQISNKKGVPNWLSQEYGKRFLEICQQAQAVIMGKTTYNILAPDNLPLKSSGTMVVLSHDTTTAPVQANVLFTDKTPADIVNVLEGRGHREAVIIGGAQTVSAFVGAALVDELILVVEPFLFGVGLPMLTGVDLESRLALLDMTRLNDDTIQLQYRLKMRTLQEEHA